MTIEFKKLDFDVPDFTEHTNSLDRLIAFSNWMYSPVDEKLFIYEPAKNIGSYLVHSNIFPNYHYMGRQPYMMYPTLNRGMANNISRFAYEGIKALYTYSNQLVSIDYNAVSANMSKGSVLEHVHLINSANSGPVDTEVFFYKVTHVKPNSTKFIFFNDPVEEYLIDYNCSFRFDSSIPHSAISPEEDYYIYLVYEKWLQE